MVLEIWLEDFFQAACLKQLLLEIFRPANFTASLLFCLVCDLTENVVVW